MTNSNQPPVQTGITPFLVVRSGSQALEFYKAAFGAAELEKYVQPNGKLTAKLAIDNAVFWLGDEEPEFNHYSPEKYGGSPVRITLTVADPETVFARALKAGARQICPVTTEASWKIGQLEDLSGHIWEIGHPLDQ